MRERKCAPVSSRLLGTAKPGTRHSFAALLARRPKASLDRSNGPQHVNAIKPVGRATGLNPADLCANWQILQASDLRRYLAVLQRFTC